MKNQKEKGITLGALVITIILLLILAGISLNLIAGSNGLINKATNAVGKYNLAAIAEEIEMAMAEVQMDYYETGNYTQTFEEYVAEKLQNEGIETANGKVTSADFPKVIYEDKSGRQIVTGTFEQDTGRIKIDGIAENSTPIAPAKPLATEVIKPENYGDAVNYSANDVNDWQVFLNDGTYIYLIASDYVPSIGMTLGTGISKTSGSDYKVYGDSQANLVNWLTTESNWSEYAKGMSGATAYRWSNKTSICRKLQCKIWNNIFNWSK